MTEQTKAEAYVRSQRPALMELTMGCLINNINTPSETVPCIFLKKVSRVAWSIYRPQFKHYGNFFKENFEIIGHPIQLQDWLAVLGDGYEMDCSNGQICKYATCENNQLCLQLFFNLTTGQPNSPEDYKAFNDITSV